jgi:hypothetical protein
VKVKVERRGESCFISHNGLTIFCNKRPEGYEFRVQTRKNEQWSLAGEMMVDKKAYAQFIELLKQL